MKKLMKTFKYISILILALSFVGCEDGDAVLPTVTAGFTYTLSDAGVATFINTSENANKYTWSFGDQKNTTSRLIDPIFAYGIGSYSVKLTAINVAGASDTFESTIMVLDKDAPLIALIGDATINVTLGDTFIDPGATALDEVDGDITANIVVGGDTVDTNTEGTYVITYNVSDSQGNAADEVERTVIVTAVTCEAETEENIDPANGDLKWTFLTNDITHTFEAFGNTSASIVDNPLIEGINTSCNVQQFIKTEGCETWSGMGTELATALDFTARINNVFKMKVLAETQVTDVTLRLERLPFPDTDPAVEKVASITATGEWQELTFDFSDVTTGTYKSVIIYFERNTGCDGDIYYFDDIIQTSEASGGGGGSDETVLLNFENNLAGVTASEFNTGGALIANPVSGGINTSPNVYEAAYTTANDWWGGIGFVFDAGLDQATTVYKAKFYSTVAPTNVLFQVEVDGTNQPVGAVQEITTANEWVELTFTLANIPSGVNRILIRPDVGDQTGFKPNTGSLYIDDITKVDGGSGGGGGGTCPAPPSGDFISDGDFEANADCWGLFDNGGTTIISTSISNGGGTNSGQITTTTFANPGLKQERFGIGTIQPNTTYIVTFDIQASSPLIDGAVFQAFTFSEPADGSNDPAVQHVLIAGDASVTSGWTTRTYEFTTAGNVDGGVSLLFELICGGAATCGGTVNIDNVSVTSK
ncbi:immunoglobulin-like domain-containing protein [Seonamhaeicola sediminis]|nr:immunoglobulin-like domain-containing protein [Seonamhaeicola sediminis]